MNELKIIQRLDSAAGQTNPDVDVSRRVRSRIDAMQIQAAPRLTIRWLTGGSLAAAAAAVVAIGLAYQAFSILNEPMNSILGPLVMVMP